MNERRELARAFLSLLVTLIVMGVLLFGVAGTWNWPLGWGFVVFFVVAILISVAVLWRLNPAIFVARARPTGQGTKGWDRVIIPILLIAYAAILPVAALDGGRFHVSLVPAWLVAVGYLLLAAGFAGVAWAEVVNSFFEVSVRIQSDRGQQVITTGPYAYIRHPGYIAGSLLAIGCALALGSFWALLPAAIVVVTMLVRTNLEDATLQRELPGYAEFAARTRYKWIPGVW